MTAARTRSWLITTAIVVVMVLVLRAQGRLWWCACGSPRLWNTDAWGPHNSQHLFDPYSFSHMSHGVLFYGFLWLVARRLSVSWRLCLVVVLEVGCELLENSDFVIDRFRAGAAAAYRGDTIANSLGDLLSCLFGGIVASRIGLWWSIVMVLAIEGTLTIWIRDNLFLDALMLVWSSDAIKAWQANH
jgi:hypothetical protein